MKESILLKKRLKDFKSRCNSLMHFKDPSMLLFLICNYSIKASYFSTGYEGSSAFLFRSWVWRDFWGVLLRFFFCIYPTTSTIKYRPSLKEVGSLVEYFFLKSSRIRLFSSSLLTLFEGVRVGYIINKIMNQKALEYINSSSNSQSSSSVIFLDCILSRYRLKVFS